MRAPEISELLDRTSSDVIQIIMQSEVCTPKLHSGNRASSAQVVCLRITIGFSVQTNLAVSEPGYR